MYEGGLNPYFIGLPILIIIPTNDKADISLSSQSLFYWITYSYINPEEKSIAIKKNVSILILLDYLFLFFLLLRRREYPPLSQSLFYWITYSYFSKMRAPLVNWDSLNPYFIGLPILISRIQA